MSFTSTPLGSNQNRRVDRNTFFNKSQSLIRNPTNSLLPASTQTSFSSAAPPTTRLPLDHTQPAHDQDNPDEPALVRFAKQKQKATGSNLEPERWSVRDTSVRIANAFSQAAIGDTSMPPSNPNDSWASGATRRSNLPRSTSVEYEKEAQSTVRRLNAPPQTIRIPAQNPLSKTTSIQHVPDSEDDEPPPVAHVRGKSPFQHVADAARSVLKPATFFMVRRSQEPEDINGRDSSSYDYAEEEQQYQEQQAESQPKSLSKRNTHKRGRISVDNKAYRPSVSDLERSDEDFEGDGKKVRRRKRNKRDSIGGPLTSLPVAGYDKRRKRKKNTKSGDGEGDEDEDDESESDDDEPEKVSEHRTSSQRVSVPRMLAPLRYSVPPDSSGQTAEADTSMDIEQGLHSIPEVDEFSDAEPLPSGPPASFSIGGFLGRIVNLAIRSILMIFSTVFRVLCYITWTFGQLIAAAFNTPKNLLNKVNFAGLAKVSIALISMYLIWQSLRHIPESFKVPTISWFSPPPLYQPPSIPASDFTQLSARLHAFEASLSSLSLENERARLRLENEMNRGKSEFSGRLVALETKAQKIKETEEEMRGKLKHLEERGSPGSSLKIKSADDQDVTSLITHLVDSVASKYTKDILARPDFALHSGGAQVIPSLTSPTYEIWPLGAKNQIIGLVTGSGHAVGRPPVTALHHDINNGHCWPFAGTQGQLGVKLAWPALVSEVTIDHVAGDVAFDMRSAPREMELWGLVEGKDNIAKLSTWLAQKRTRRQEAIAGGEPIRPEDEDWVYPKGLPTNLQYARIASFTYDIHSPANIQTYPAAQDVRNLGVDFGLVVLFVNSNWGRDEFTCLYRLRVHGERVGEIPLPYNPESTASSH